MPKQLDLVVRRALLGQTRAGRPPITTPAQLAGALTSFVRPDVAAGGAGSETPRAARGAAARQGRRFLPDPVGGDDPAGFPDGPPAASRLALVGAVALAALIFSVAAWGMAGRSAQATRATSNGTPEQTVDTPGQTVAASPLTPVSAVLYESSGGGEGRAALAIDDSPDTAWRSHWYTTASFGNLEPGLGLLVDMGSPVSISSVRVMVGATPGADLQLRIGDAADSLAGLRVVASDRTTADTTDLSVTSPVAGRYVLLWFTGLPPQDGGTGQFQATVRDVTVFGAI